MKATHLLAIALACFGLSAHSHSAMISGNALQDVLNDITVGGDSSINVHSDQLVNDEKWSVSAASGSVATLIIELAGFADSNSFGIYDVSNPASFVQLIDGPSGPGSQSLVNILADGQVRVNFTNTGIYFADNLFGFYLDVAATGDRWYSQTDLNADGVDHMVAFSGNDSDVLQLPGFAPGLWQSTEYILAFEDLFNGGDRDYTDFVVMVASVVPVPEPGSLALLALALAGLMGSRRRRA